MDVQPMISLHGVKSPTRVLSPREDDWEVPVKLDRFRRTILLLTALLLSVIAVRPYLIPQRVEAQSSERYDFYIEPGTYMIRAPAGSRQVLGKVVVDLKTGDVWGFPTLGADPYPSDITKSEPPTSKPIYLGKYDFAAAKR
jgi:hypothetical protein